MRVRLCNVTFFLAVFTCPLPHPLAVYYDAIQEGQGHTASLWLEPTLPTPALPAFPL